MGRKYPPPHPTLGLGERHKLSQLDLGRSPGRKWFYNNLFSADRFCWQQVTANSSPFCPEKWGVLYPSVQKVGGRYRYPSSPRKLCLCTDTTNLDEYKTTSRRLYSVTLWELLTVSMLLATDTLTPITTRTGTITTRMMTPSTIPVTENTIDAIPMCWAVCGSLCARPFAITTHTPRKAGKLKNLVRAVSELLRLKHGTLCVHQPSAEISSGLDSNPTCSSATKHDFTSENYWRIN